MSAVRAHASATPVGNSGEDGIGNVECHARDQIQSVLCRAEEILFNTKGIERAVLCRVEQDLVRITESAKSAVAECAKTNIDNLARR
jgi:hypothetical protein